jgi:flagellar biosynthesis protein FlhF
MQVKRFVAPTISEAVRQARAEFGPNAVLLQTGKARRPGLFGFLRPGWVAVTAGRDEGLAGVETEKREPAAAPNKGVKGAPGAPVAKAKAGAKKKKGGKKRGKKTQAAQGRVQAKAKPKKQAQTAGGGRQAVEPAEPRAVGGTEPALRKQRAASDATTAVAVATGEDEPKRRPADRNSLLELAVRHLVERLRQQEVAARYLDELGALLYQRVRQGGEAPRQHLFNVLAEQFPPAQPWRLGEGPYVVPLVGPTGVGKTTTLAKLATTYALTLGRRVGLLTVDTYRVAAVEQLRTYADILSLPLVVAYTPQEVRAALEQLSDCELVLVDTAGRSPRAKAQMEELTTFLAEMGDVHTHLVFSATTRESDLTEIIANFSTHAPLEGLIVTKLDETLSYGCLYNAVRQSGKPIAFVTTGQSVPEDIVIADAACLASYLVGIEP